ncbi:unnamed protein product, partial [marine sediment metagenome]
FDKNPIPDSREGIEEYIYSLCRWWRACKIDEEG